MKYFSIHAVHAKKMILNVFNLNTKLDHCNRHVKFKFNNKSLHTKKDFELKTINLY